MFYIHFKSLIRTEVVLKFDFSSPAVVRTTRLIRTEVVLKWGMHVYLRGSGRFNKNRSCIEITKGDVELGKNSV